MSPPALIDAGAGPKSTKKCCCAGAKTRRDHVVDIEPIVSVHKTTVVNIETHPKMERGNDDSEVKVK